MVAIDEPLLLLGSIVFVFILILTLQRRIPWRMCAICIAVSLTWIVSLGLFHLGYLENQLLIALLMGQSMLGVYYLLESNVKEHYLTLRVPFLLTITYLGYMGLTLQINLYVILLLFTLWAVGGLILTFRHQPRFRATAQKLIECCRNW